MSSSQQNFKSRLIWVDLIKGFAILGIVLFHFFQIYPSSLAIINFLDRHSAKLGFMMVDIFFLLAGFNISYQIARLEGKKVNWYQWLKKRLFKLYPTYWLAIIYCILLYLINNSLSVKLWENLHFIILGIPDYEKFKIINPGFWFLSVIIQAYLITPFIFKVSKNNPNFILKIGFSGALINKIVCFYFGYISKYESRIYYFLLQIHFIGSYFFALCIGIYAGFIYQRYGKFRNQDYIQSSILFSIFIIIQSCFAINNIDYRYKLGIDILFIPLFFLILYSIAQFIIKRITWISSGIQKIGLNSYYIYLIHQPLFFICLGNIVNLLNINPYIEIIIVFIIASIILWFNTVLFRQIDRLINKKLVSLLA